LAFKREPIDYFQENKAHAGLGRSSLLGGVTRGSQQRRRAQLGR